MSIPIGQAVLHYKESQRGTSHFTQTTVPFFNEVQFGKHIPLDGSPIDSVYNFKHKVDVWINDPFSSSGSASTKQITIPSHKLSSLFSYIARSSSTTSSYEPGDVDTSLIFYRVFVPQSQKSKKKWLMSKVMMNPIPFDLNQGNYSSVESSTGQDQSTNFSSSSEIVSTSSKSASTSEDMNWLEGMITKIVCTFDEPGESIYIDGVEYSNCTVLEINGKWNSRIKELQIIVPFCLDNSI